MQSEPDKIKVITKWIEGEASGRWAILALVIIVIGLAIVFTTAG